MSSLSAAQRREIDLAKELLVTKAENLLQSSGVTPGRDFGHSQLRNLVAVAMETESPAVVLNFIRYQMGRDDRKKGWAGPGAGNRRLGDLFVAELHEAGGAVETALETVQNVKADKVVEQHARMELIRYFLGFATRYMKYLEMQSDRRGGGR